MCILTEFPYCCKARVLARFGHGHLNEREDSDSFKRGRDSKEKIKNYLDNAMLGLIDVGVQVIFASPTNHQPEAIEALLEYGFVCAHDEDLEKSKVIIRQFKYDERGNIISYGKKDIVEYEHMIFPMFYTIPRTKEQQHISYAG